MADADPATSCTSVELSRLEETTCPGAKTSDRKGVAELLKEQVALLALLVLFGGIGSVESYYESFGLRAQDIELVLRKLRRSRSFLLQTSRAT